MSDSDEEDTIAIDAGHHSTEVNGEARENALFSPNTKDAHSSLTSDELELLSRLERENKRLEDDRKAATSLSLTVGEVPIGVNLARRASGTSLVSSTSAASTTAPGLGLTGDEPTTPEIAVESGSSTEEERWTLWGKIVNDWESYRKKTTFVKELVRQGIPQPFRGLAWQLISGACDSGAKELYSEYMKQTSPCEKIIRRDIARTYPEHDFFREKDGLGQESLFNVMKAYSLHDREVGYCQGSAFIVGLLLMQMPEEEAFAVLVQLMQRFQLRELFKPSMQELGLSMHQLDSLVHEQLPDLHAHFTLHTFHTTMYASSWFLTLFATSLPQDLAFRVMDLILAEGTIFIFQMGMAILRMSAIELMALDMEHMIRFFQNEVPQKAEADGLESLIKSALCVKISAKKMKKWEKEYLQIKSKEHEELVELRRLRTENKLLRQRIDHLEKESAALADRLIQGQVTRAQEAEESFVIKRELASVKQQETDAATQLEKMKDELEKLKMKSVGCTPSSPCNSVVPHLSQSPSAPASLGKPPPPSISALAPTPPSSPHIRLCPSIHPVPLKIHKIEVSTTPDVLYAFNPPSTSLPLPPSVKLTSFDSCNLPMKISPEIPTSLPIHPPAKRPLSIPTSTVASVPSAPLKVSSPYVAVVKGTRRGSPAPVVNVAPLGKGASVFQTGKAAFETEASEMIKALQVELMAIRLKEAESDHNIKEVESKLEEAVEQNRVLQEGPHSSIASLQDDLTAVKLREAEANLSLKEMKQKVSDLEQQWKNYLNAVEGVALIKEGSKAEKKEMVKLQEDLMLAKLNENEAAVSAKDHRQRLMEMETQNQVLSNQLKRQDDEICRLKERVADKNTSERNLRHNILEFRHQVSDLESKLREENMMGRIKDAEQAQVVGDLHQKIAELESKNMEMVTEGQLASRDGDEGDVSLAALSLLVRGEGRRSSRGHEADAEALEEEIEQMRVNERVEARLLQDSSCRGRTSSGGLSARPLGRRSSLDVEDSALSFDADGESDAELEAVLNSTFKEARTELENLLFHDEKSRDLQNEVLLATRILSNKSHASSDTSTYLRSEVKSTPASDAIHSFSSVASGKPKIIASLLNNSMKAPTVEEGIYREEMRSEAMTITHSEEIPVTNEFITSSSQDCFSDMLSNKNESKVGLDMELLLAGLSVNCDPEEHQNLKNNDHHNSTVICNEESLHTIISSP